jgi:DNA-binding NtrC family response regulator
MRAGIEGVSAPALALLQAYDYPGNARELANTVERAVIVANGKRLEEQDLPSNIKAAVTARRQKERPPSLAQLEAATSPRCLPRRRATRPSARGSSASGRKNL